MNPNRYNRLPESTFSPHQQGNTNANTNAKDDDEWEAPPVTATTVPPSSRRINWTYMTPLLFAPTLPLIRIGFRHRPVLRDRLFYGTIALGLVHGTVLMMKAQDS